MKTPPQPSRPIYFVIGVALLAVAILWAAVGSWRESLKVRGRFESIRAENSHVSSHLRDAVLELQSLLTSFEATGEGARWEQFRSQRDHLGQWIAEAARTPTSEREKALFAKITTGFEKYRDETDAIAKSRAPVASGEALSPRLKRIEKVSQSMLALSAELSAARRAATGQYVEESQKAIVDMQKFIFGSLLALLSVAAWGARIVYRDTIGPLEESLVETRENAERNEKLAALGILAAGVAHEIRNPLTAIKARLYTQQKLLTAGSAAHNDSILIGNEIDRLARITNQFLAFARPAEPVLEKIAPAVLLRNVRELLAPRLAEEAIELVIDDQAAGLAIRADAHQLQQVLINLVQNAAESVGREGQITLRARAEEPAAGGKPPQAVVLEVEDSGRGISSEVAVHLFDPFFSTKPGGTGLGLSIAARIIEKHGGTIRYETEVDRGTTFAVVLPTQAEA